ncbi:MAG: hypothetical protein SGCHY_001804 [Lobulomycetales sp.]
MVTFVDEILAQSEFRDFAVPAFDASAYADTILAAPEESPFHGLDLGKSDLSRYEQNLATIKERVDSLNQLFDSISSKIRGPEAEIKLKVKKLERLHECCELLRVLVRFLNLAKRLTLQMDNNSGSRELIKSAITINDIETLVEKTPLSGINVADVEMQRIFDAKNTIQQAAEDILTEGLASQNQSDLFECLAVFYHLGLLNSRVLSKAIFLRSLGADSAQKPSAEATKAFWTRLEAFIDNIYSSSAAIYVLDLALSRKRDTLTGELYSEIVSETIGSGGVVSYFWKSLTQTFEKELKQAVKSSQILQQLLQLNYPRVLRMFGGLFSNIKLSYATRAVPSTVLEDKCHDHTSMLQPLLSFESIYLGKSLSRLLDPVNVSFSSGKSKLPSRDDVDRITRCISSELEIAKFDYNLLKAVSSNVKKALVTFSAKCENAASSDTMFNVSGNATASYALLRNIEIINAVWRICDGTWAIVNDFQQTKLQSEEGTRISELVVQVVGDSVESLMKLLQGFVQPVFFSMSKECESVLVKIHRESFGGTQAKSSKSSSQSQLAQESATSPYIVELSRRKIPWMVQEVINRLNCGDDQKEWVRALGARIVEFFLRHASLVCPLNDSGKLKLASDMTQLELGLAQLFAAAGMTPLLFLDFAQISSPYHTSALDPIVIIQHLFVRAYPIIQSPRQVYNWSETEYSEYLDKRSSQEVSILFSNCLDAYAAEVNKKGQKSFTPEYPILRQLLK